MQPTLNKTQFKQNPNPISLTSSYSYSSQNVSLILLRRAFIMRRVLTEPEKTALNWIVGRPTTNQSNAVGQLLCIQLSTT